MDVYGTEPLPISAARKQAHCEITSDEHFCKSSPDRRAIDEQTTDEKIHRVAVESSIENIAISDDLDVRLLLTWAAFLKRDSLGSQDEDWTITFKLAETSHSASFLLSTAYPAAESSVADVFEKLKHLLDEQQCKHQSVNLERGLLLEARSASQPGSPQVSFAIEASVHGKALRIACMDRDHETSDTITQIYLNTILDLFSLLSHPETESLPLSGLSQITHHELQQIWKWNNFLPSPIETCVHEYFIEQARKQPKAPAVTAWDGSFTYAEVNELSQKLAHKLRTLGIARGVAVPLCFEKSVWTVIAVLAVMRVGAAFVLTDPSQPESRLRIIAKEVNAKVLLTSQRYVELGKRITSASVVAPVGPSLRDELSENDKIELELADSNSLMYIIFTSGSTGKPKGVMISHRSYTTGAIQRADIVGYTPETRVLDFASYAFDVSIDCMLLTLATGGCICVPSEDDRVNNLSGAIRKMKVNMVHTTPSIARILDASVVQCLKVLGLGGEAVPARDAAKWNEQTGGGVVIAYGPSECTVGCTFRKFDEERTGKKYTSLGKGCGGCLWIVDPDDHNNLSPLGAAGELLVEGTIVGDGYINEPDKTTAVFIESPKWLAQGSRQQSGRYGRLYKTGDLVRYDPDGSGAVIFVGRKDQQVKIRGQRVELEEVEHHLRQRLPQATAVAAEVIRPGGDGEPTLAAFVVEHDLKQERVTSGSCNFSLPFKETLVALEMALAIEIPKYMVPAYFICLQQIPTTTSGKTDRKQLRSIGERMSRKDLSSWRKDQNNQIRPIMLSSKEKALAGLWAKVLNAAEQITAEDHFFALGGDSLRAMRLVGLARQERLFINMKIIFSHPKLKDMAAETSNVGQKQQEYLPPYSLLPADWPSDDRRQQVAELCKVDESNIEDIYPCTPLQEGLMALSAKVPEAYVAQRVLRLPDCESATRFRAAVDAAVCGCTILRTCIVHVPRHGLFQVVMHDSDLWRESDDLQIYLANDREESMGLGKALCRLALIGDRCSDGVDFVITMHHALYDGWSMPLVADRINRAYQDDRGISRTEFKVFVKYLQDQNRQASEAYWRCLLEKSDTRQFPELPYPGYQTKADSLLEHYIPVKTASHSNSTLATLIRAAWALAASTFADTRDIIFGETLTGRNADVLGIEEIEGPLITTVPMRIRLQSTCHVSEYLQQVHQQIVERMPHEHLGLQNIRLLSRDARQACDLRTGLVLHPCVEDDSHKMTKGPASALVPAGALEAAQEALKFNSYALMIVCTLDKEGFLTMASFDSNTISTEQMQQLLGEFERAVEILSTRHDQNLGTVWHLPNEPLSLTNTASIGQRKVCRDSPAVSADNRTRIENPSKSSNPKEAIEVTVLSICSRVLKLDGSEINSNDDFFELGGDSIGAMKLVSELRHIGHNLSVGQVFDARRLSAVANLLTSTPAILPAEENALGQTIAAIPAGSESRDIGRISMLLHNPQWQIRDVYQARHLQEVAFKGTTTLPRYSMRYELFHMSGQINKQLLFDACQRLVATTEILRTVFVEVDQKCYGVVVDDIKDLIDQYEIEEGVEDFAKRLCDVDIQGKVHAGSSFVKFFWVEGRQGSSCLIFRLSHAQYDEICLPVMLEQLSALYQSKSTQETPPFSSFVQYATDVNKPMAIAYWRNLLHGSTLSVLQGPEVPVKDRRKLASLTKTVDITKRPKAVTIASFPTAAWALCLARKLSQRDVVFGEVVSGRNTGFRNAEAVMGPCWQYIPARIRFETGWTGLDLLSAVQVQHIASSEFTSIGVSELVQYCTDWPKGIDWFDSVVHQDVSHVEQLSFLNTDSRLETYYPHVEPLREWKVQAFAGDSDMTLEIVIFEEWKSFGKALLEDFVACFEQLIHNPDKTVLE